MNHAITIIDANLTQQIINQDKQKIIDIVQRTYLGYHKQECINPDSFFLRFPDSDSNRIIGLAASNVSGSDKLSGIKWIASYPDNLKKNLPRASASILLNDYETGRLKALIEGTYISAARTAASATLAVRYLAPSTPLPQNILVIGCGVISKTILEFMQADNLNIGTVYLYDTHPEAAQKLKTSITKQHSGQVIILTNLQKGLDLANMIVCATTAIKPFLSKTSIQFESLQKKVILGISLRDFCHDIIYASNNIVDDVEHCLKANTSVHLTEQHYKHRDFIHGNISDLIEGKLHLDSEKPTIFSPFGMGVLDLNVANYIYKRVEKSNLGVHCAFQN